MALNIKDPEVDRLATEISRMTGESKTRAVRRALEERRERLALQITERDRTHDIKQFLEQEIWPLVPERLLGRRLRRGEEDRILGYGPDGV